MRYSTIIAAAAAFTVLGAAAGMAQPKIYAYHSSHNFCPAGLQPVTMNGEICCGTPNQGISYQQALSHPVTHKPRVHRTQSRRADCPVGTKGCTFD